jgi:regulatory protein
MDAYTAGLTLLSRRELSTRQLRERLARRRVPSGDIDAAVVRLTSAGVLDDRRVALAAARQEAIVRRRGRRRVQHRLERLGIAADTATDAINAALEEVDEGAILDQAIARRLGTQSTEGLDRRAIARLVRRLVGQGFEPDAIYARLRRRPHEADE